MEKVSVIAVKSFVNQITGSVTKKQKLLLPINLAKEFKAMGLVVDEVGKPEAPLEPVIPPASETTDGTDTPSASLPVETVLPTNTLQQPKRGRGRRAGKQS